MAFTLKDIVPWGRSFEEYIEMFALSEDDLRKRILGCGDGPASFNSAATRLGGHVVSVDPIYQFTAEEIRKRIEETYDSVMEQTKKNKDEFVWEHPSSVEELGIIRMAAMDEFLSDFENGKTQGRYVCASVPDLPWEDKEFDVALCSHFLFLYSDHLSEDFHVQSIMELCRVATETRIFPLLELGAKRSRYLGSVIEHLDERGLSVRIEKVDYEFQKGGNEMMVVNAT